MPTISALHAGSGLCREPRGACGACPPWPQPPACRIIEDNDRHHRPHIHARYQGANASIAIDDASLLDGDLPRRQLRLVQAWIEIHRDELLANWDLATAGDTLFRIDPLK